MGALLLNVWLCPIALATSLDEARDHHQRAEFDQALAAYDIIADGAGPDADRAVARNNACVIRTDRGDFAAAEANCRSALAMRRALGDWRGVARTLNNLARVLQARGDGDAARAAHEQALEINIQRADAPAQVISRINLAVLDTEQRRYTQALDQLAAVEPLIERVDPGWGDSQRALLALNRAVIHERIGAYTEALLYIDDAVRRSAESAPHLSADAHLNRGVILRNLGDPTQALESYRTARDAFSTRGDRVAAQNALLNEAVVQWRDLGDPEASTRAVRQFLSDQTVASAEDRRRAHYLATRLALQRGQKDVARTHIDQLAALAPDDALLFDARARAHFSGGDIDAAIDQSQRAIDAVERDRAALTDARFRQRLLSDRRDAYALAIDYLYERYSARRLDTDFDAALRIAARGKALGLIEARQTAGLMIPSTPGTRYVDTYVAGARVHVWSIDANARLWRTLDATRTRQAAAAVRRATMRDLPLPANDVAVLDGLLGIGTVGSLVVALDGDLAGVPLDVLFNGRSAAPVIRHVAAVAHATSAPAADSTKSPSLLGIAQPSVPAGSTRHPALRSLPKLGALSEELRIVSTAFGNSTVVLSGVDATERAFLASDTADVLHIASHAVFDARLDDGAVLILGAGDSNSDAADGLLYPRDIAALNRPARLTVLSACSTASSSSSAGAPVNHLAGAFLASGSRAVVASLWNVDDAVTAVVMEQLYARLAQGMLPHDALHETKQALASQPGWDRPSLWAPWVVYGPSDQPVFSASTAQAPPWRIVLLLSLAAGLLSLSLRRQPIA